MPDDTVCWRQQPEFSRPLALILDIDGVVIHTPSYHVVIVRAVEQALRSTSVMVPDTSVQAVADIKRQGGYNSDWDIASALIWGAFSGIDMVAFAAAHPGGGLAALVAAGAAGMDVWPRQKVSALCSEIYAGSEACERVFGTPSGVSAQVEPGVYQSETPLVTREDLSGPWRIAAYTGRIRSEAEFGLRRCGLWDIFEPALVVAGDRYLKPDPAGLAYALGLVGCQRGLFVGDNRDDLETVLRQPRKDVLFAAVGTGVLGPQGHRFLFDLGADAASPRLADLLADLRRRLS